jgi:hypothetical protein
VGENCEQLWAQMRPLYKLTRYMTGSAYQDTLDDALVLVADGKMHGCVEFMKQQQDAMERKLSKWTGCSATWVVCKLLCLTGTCPPDLSTPLLTWPMFANVLS